MIYLGRYQQARELLNEAIAYTQRLHIHYIVEGARRMLAEVDYLTGGWPWLRRMGWKRPYP